MVLSAGWLYDSDLTGPAHGKDAVAADENRARNRSRVRAELLHAAWSLTVLNMDPFIFLNFFLSISDFYQVFIFFYRMNTVRNSYEKTKVARP